VPVESLLLPLVLVAVACAVGWVAWRLEQQRRARYLAFAAEHGWTYTPRDDTWVHRFEGMPFGRGSSRRATHVLRGSFAGRDMVAFHYRYLTRSHNGQQQTTQTHRFTVVALRLPAHVPTLELTGENVLTRIGSALGLADVELESEDFNRRYRVTADDRRFVYDVLHPRTMEQLCASPTVNLRLCGADALLWDTGFADPEQLPAMLAPLAQLVDGIPSYVWSDRQSDHRGGGAA
jgi:hypothetical protein